MAGKTVSTEVVFLGNTADLEAAMVRAGIAAEDSSSKIRGSAASAGKAAAEQAKMFGASADEQESAAGRAAAAFTSMNAEITRAQRAAGNAAVQAAKAVGGSVDEQRSAYTRAIASQSEYEASQRRAADAAKVSADQQAAAAKKAASEQVAAAKAASDAQEMAAKKSKAASDALSSFGGKVAIGGIAALGAGMYESVKGATALQSAMERLHTQAGVTQAGVKQLTTGVLNMAGSVGTSPDQLAGGMYHVASSLNATLPAASRSATELKVLRVAAEGAGVGNSNLVDTTNALDAAVVSGIKGVQNYRQAMGAMNATVGAGDMSMQDLADAFGTGVVAKAKMAGVSIKSLGGAVATLGDNNIRGAQAGTLLGSTIRIMGAPSEAAAEALKAVGISSLQLGTDMRSGGLIGALDDLKQHLRDSGATAEQQSLILTRAFGGRQSTGVQLLLSQLDRLKSKTADVGSGAKTFAADWLAYTHTIGYQIDSLKATVASLADKFGLYLIPKVEATGKALKGVIDWMNQNRGAAEALGVVVSSVLGTAVAAFAYGKAVAFVNSTKQMAQGIGNLAKGIGSAVPTILTKLGLIGPAAEGAEAEVATADEGIVASADATAVGVDAAIGSTGIGAIMIGLGIAAAEMATHWGTVMNGMKTAVNGMVEVAEKALNGLIGVLDKAISSYNHSFGVITGDIGSVGNVGTGGVFNTGGGNANAQANREAARIMGAPLGTTVNPNTGKQSLVGGSNEQRVENFLLQQGFSKVAVAGIMGNLQQEHGFQTSNVPVNAQGDGGMGIAQWTGGRLTSEQQYATAHHMSSTSLTAQLDYMMQELHGGYSSTASAINQATTPAQAAAIWDKMYEGGTDPGGIREQYAQQIYASMGGHAAASGGSGGSAGSGRSMPTSASLKAYLKKASGGTAKAKAVAMSTVPAAVATMLATAEALQGTQYSHAGDHGGVWDSVAELKKIGVDCSGFVSAVLHSGGVRMPYGQTTQGLPSYLQPGQGKDVTVWDRHTGPTANEHTLIDIMGKWFESGGNPANNPKGGVSELTAKEAAAELHGGGAPFQAYHPVIGGKMLTDKQLAAMHLGIGPSAGGPGGLSSAANQLEQAFVQLRKSALTAADSLLTRLGNAIQNGTVRTLDSTLGFTGTTQMREPLSMMGSAFKNLGLNPALKHWHNHVDVATDLHRRIEGYSSEWRQPIHGLSNTASLSQIDKRLMPDVTAATGGTQQAQAMQQKVEALIATGQSSLATKLLAQWKAAQATLAQELYAQQKTKDADSLALQATEESDRTKLASDHAAAVLDVVKAQSQMAQDASASQVTIMKDQQTQQSDATQASVTYSKDQEQLVSDAAQAQVQYIKDMSQTAQDQFAAMAAAVKDQTTLMADASTSVVDMINDQAQTQSDTLGERGLFGLNLVAQQLQVQLDVMKTGFDQQINVAQSQLDALQAQADAAENAAQINMDQVTTAEDQLVALQQQHLDTVTLSEDQASARAQAHLDAVTLHEDQLLGKSQQHMDAVTVTQDQKIVGAQAHVDSVTLKQDMAVQLAQTAVDLSANASKAQQDVTNAQLKYAQENQALQVNNAQGALTQVTDNANKLIQNAASAYANVQGAAATAVQQATAQYQQAQDQASADIQKATNQYTNAQNAASLATENSQAYLNTITGQFNVALAGASQNLQAIQDTAAQQEATLQGKQTVTQAEAQTQFAGSGITVNITGINPQDSAAIANAVGWELRTALPPL